jgi:hypothetical protein
MRGRLSRRKRVGRAMRRRRLLDIGRWTQVAMSLVPGSVRQHGCKPRQVPCWRRPGPVRSRWRVNSPRLRTSATVPAWDAFAETDEARIPRRHAAVASGQRPILDEPAALYWQLIAGDQHGEIVGVICPNCLTLREQRAIRAEKARVLRRLKRGLPVDLWRSAARQSFCGARPPGGLLAPTARARCVQGKPPASAGGVQRLAASRGVPRHRL